MATFTFVDVVDTEVLWIILLVDEFVGAEPALLKEVDDSILTFLGKLLEKLETVEKFAVGLPGDLHLESMTELFDDHVFLLCLGLLLLDIEVLHVFADLRPDVLADFSLFHVLIHGGEGVGKLALILKFLVQDSADGADHETEESAG